MADLEFTFTDTGFPAGFVGDANDYKDTFLLYLQASVDSDNLLLGQVGGTAPTDHTIVWLDNGVWKYFQTSAWIPMAIQVWDSTSSFTTTFRTLGTMTADRIVTFQDKDGTIAYLEDMDFGRNAKVLTGHGAVIINWELSNNFYHSLDAGTTTTYSFSNSFPGQEIWVLTINGVATPVNFPANVLWISPGTEPNQTASGTDLWIIRNVAGSFIGQQLADLS